MTWPRVIGAAFILLAFLSVFFFPFPATVLLMAAASCFLPVTGIALGILAEVLYYPGHGWPVAFIFGLGATVLGYLLQRFVKERIM